MQKPQNESIISQNSEISLKARWLSPSGFFYARRNVMFGIDDAVSAVTGLADTVIKRVWPDATEVEKAKLDQIANNVEQEFKLRAKQIAVNMKEAQSGSVFVSGWRPFVGWVCGSALAYAALIEPIGRFIAVVVFGYAGAFPVIDTDLTLQILLGLLGLAGYRTFEKHSGVARK